MYSSSVGLIALVLFVAVQSAPLLFADYGSDFMGALSEWSSMNAFKRPYGPLDYVCSPAFRSNFFGVSRHRRDTNSTRMKRSFGCGQQSCFCQQPNCCCIKPVCVQLQLQPQPQLQPQAGPCCCPQMCSQGGCAFGNPSTSCCKIQPPPTCYTVQPPPQCMLLQPPPIPIMVQPPPVTCRVQSAPMCLQIKSQPLCCCNQQQQPTCKCCQQQPTCSYQPSCCGSRKRRSLDMLRHKLMDKNAAEQRALTNQQSVDEPQKAELSIPTVKTSETVARPERNTNHSVLFNFLKRIRSVLLSSKNGLI